MSSIAIVAPDVTGSIGSVAWNHACLFSPRHQVHVVARMAGADADARVHGVPVRPTTWNGLHRFCHVPNELSFGRAIRRALSDLCAEHRVDVVWCHGHSAAVWVAALRARFGFEIVMTVHGDIHERPAGTYDPLLASYYRWVTPRAYRLADRVHVLSPHLASWAERRGAAPNKIVTIPNGIDPTEIGLVSPAPRTAESFLPGGMLRILYVGALWRLKGLDSLLRACAMLKAEGGTRFRLKLVGDGPERDRLRNLTDELGIGDDVEFVGRLPRQELGGQYRSADVLCLPSLSETFPTVVLEAAVAGLPVVASRTGGIPHMVEDGKNGWLPAPGNPADLARCLRVAATSGPLLAEYSSRAMVRVMRLYSWADVGRQLNAVVEGLQAR